MDRAMFITFKDAASQRAAASYYCAIGEVNRCVGEFLRINVIPAAETD